MLTAVLATVWLVDDPTHRRNVARSNA